MHTLLRQDFPDWPGVMPAVGRHVEATFGAEKQVGPGVSRGTVEHSFEKTMIYEQALISLES
jgi:hypothetical protein